MSFFYNYSITNVLFLVLLGNIRYWNDPRVLTDNNAATKAVLASISKPIRLVVRQDSSGLSSVLGSAFSSFNPAQPTATFAGSTFDSSFATSVGTSSTPTWCGVKTDEIQKISITGCNHSLAAGLKLVTMAIIDINSNVQSFTFSCDASASSFRSLFMSVNTGKSVFVSVSQGSSPSFTNVITLGYQASIGGAKNWYQPYVMSVAAGLKVTVSTLQEGGYLNSQFATISALQEIKSLWISKSATFNATLTYGTSSFNFTATTGGIVSHLSASLLPTVWSSIAAVDHTNWKEYQITFLAMSKSTVAKSMAVKVTTPGLGLVASVNTLTTANNYPVFFDSAHKYGLSGSGQYTCYKREHNYTAWSFNTGYNDGIPAEVNIYY